MANIDLQKIQTEIIKGFNEGEDDDLLAKRLNIAPAHVTAMRMMLGLRYIAKIDVFKESKTLHKNNFTEKFEVKFGFEEEVLKKLRMSYDNEYTFFASVVSPKTIQINFLEKPARD
jgi:hypothetical protein